MISKVKFVGGAESAFAFSLVRKDTAWTIRFVAHPARQSALDRSAIHRGRGVPACGSIVRLCWMESD